MPEDYMGCVADAAGRVAALLQRSDRPVLEESTQPIYLAKVSELRAK